MRGSSKIEGSSLQKSTNNHSKTDANSYQFFDWFFDWFLVHVGPMLGPKIHLKSIKNQLKHNFRIWLCFWLILCWFMLDCGGFWGPTWGREPSLATYEKTRFLRVLEPRWAKVAPRVLQEARKSLLRAAQEPPRVLQEGLGERFFIDCW